MRMTIDAPRPLAGTLRPPGDKSIAHRALIFATLATGRSTVHRWLKAGVTESMLTAVNAFGVRTQVEDDRLLVDSPGVAALRAPDQALSCGSSATTLRLLMGLAGRLSSKTVLDGTPGLRRRPMERVAEPLRAMGVSVETSEGGAPVTLTGGDLRGIDYRLPTESAQLQTALVIAALGAKSPTRLRHGAALRDHTVRFLRDLGLPILADDDGIRVEPADVPSFSRTLAGDFSAAAFFVVGASLGNERLLLEQVGINRTRTGLLDVLRKMGASITVQDPRLIEGEPVADVIVGGGRLKGVSVSGEDVVRMIDEFPVFTLAALAAEGITEVRDARELRFKESDRIAALADELGRLGAVIQPTEDGFRIEGPQRLRSGTVDARGDHRLAMTFAIAALLADGPVVIDGADIASESYPTFYHELRRLGWSVTAS